MPYLEAANMALQRTVAANPVDFSSEKGRSGHLDHVKSRVAVGLCLLAMSSSSAMGSSERGKWRSLRTNPSRPHLSSVFLAPDHTLDVKGRVLDNLVAGGKEVIPYLFVTCNSEDQSLLVAVQTHQPSEPTPDFPGRSTALVAFDSGEQFIVLARDTGTALILQGPAKDIRLEGLLLRIVGKDLSGKEKVLDLFFTHRRFVFKWAPRGSELRLADYDISGFGNALATLESCKYPVSKPTVPTPGSR